MTQQTTQVQQIQRIVAALAARFPMVWCSQCGRGFGPGNSGFSHCRDHGHLTVVED